MSWGHFARADMGVGEPEGAQQHRIESPAAPSPAAKQPNSQTANQTAEQPGLKTAQGLKGLRA
jgi:hypothetical protein